MIRSLTPHFAISALVVLVLHLFRNKTLLFLSSYAALMLFIPTFLGLMYPDAIVEAKPNHQNFSFVQFNVLKHNDHHATVINKVLESGADIVSLQEIDTVWHKDIREKISATYPYSLSYPSEVCCIGLCLYSKIPLQNAHVEFFGDLPNIVADIQIDGENIHVVSSHTQAPIYAWKFEGRNQHLKDLTSYLQKIQGAKMVLGDFNSVPWDKFLTDFKEGTKLNDSRHSYAATFPSWLGKFGIPIDYIFYSKEIECIGFTAIQSQDSDHNGIKGVYQLKGNSIVKK